MDSKELVLALDTLEKEKNISKDTLLEAIRQSLLLACEKNFDVEPDNVVVNIDPDTCEFEVYMEKTVVDVVEDPTHEIAVAEAKMKNPMIEEGDIVRVDLDSKKFGRIATQTAKNIILQKIREEERKSLYELYYEKEHEVVTGTVQRYNGRNVIVSLGKIEATLIESEMIHKKEHTEDGKEMITVEKFKPGQEIKLYVVSVESRTKGPKITISRTHPDLVKRLFENQVAEVHDGTVEIRSIAREAGSRTKIAVYSNDENVDPVGACVGMNGARVNKVVAELNDEKVDIINWDENPGLLIENALSPAKVIYVEADADEKTAEVVVPDYQLSLAIGKEGQNARLAARLTGFKIDIKSETQAREAGELLEYASDYEEEEELEEEFDENLEESTDENAEENENDAFDTEDADDFVEED